MKFRMNGKMAVITTPKSFSAAYSHLSLSVGYTDLAGRVLMRTGQSAVLICGGRRSSGGFPIDTCYEKQGWMDESCRRVDVALPLL